jgi:hypothetical protein
LDFDLVRPRFDEDLDLLRTRFNEDLDLLRPRFNEDLNLVRLTLFFMIPPVAAMAGEPQYPQGVPEWFAPEAGYHGFCPIVAPRRASLPPHPAARRLDRARLIRRGCGL